MSIRTTPVAYTRALKEYMWWRAVRSTQSLFETMDFPSYESTKDPYVIFKSEARSSLHDAMEARAAEIAGGDEITIDDYAAAIDDVIANRVSCEGTPISNVLSAEYAGTPAQCQIAFEQMLASDVWPISPFDPAYADLEGTLLSGTRLSGAKLEKLAGSAQNGVVMPSFTSDGVLRPVNFWYEDVLVDISGHDRAGDGFVPSFAPVGSSRMAEFTHRTRDGKDMSRKYAYWGSLADWLGLPLLAQHLDHGGKDWSKICTDIFDWPDLSFAGKLQREKASVVKEQIKHATTILDRFDEWGWQWEISAEGRSQGRMIVSLPEKGVKVRLIDLNEPQYVGRAQMGPYIAYRSRPAYMDGKRRYEEYAPEFDVVVHDGEVDVSLGEYDMLAPMMVLINQPLECLGPSQADGSREFLTDENGDVRLVGEFGTRSDDANIVRTSGGYRFYNPAYTSKKGFRRTYAAGDEGSAAREVFVCKVGNEVENSTFFDAAYIGNENQRDHDPEAFLQDSFDVAKEAWYSSVDVAELVEVSQAEGVTADSAMLSASALDGLRRSYLKILCGEQDALLRPDGRADVESPASFFDDEGREWLSVQALVRQGIGPDEARRIVVETHMDDSFSAEVGLLEAHDTIEDGRIVRHTFDPAGLARWSGGYDGSMAQFGAVASALRALSDADMLDRGLLLGMDANTGKANRVAVARLMDRVISFDEQSAVSVSEKRENALMDDNRFAVEYWDSVLNAVVDGLLCQGVDVDVDDIVVDANGTLRWRGRYKDTMTKFTSNRTVFQTKEEGVQALRASTGTRSAIEAEGILGPFFEPDRLGIVRCHFQGSPDISFVPSYKARLDRSIAHKTQPVAKRLLLDNYTTGVAEAIQAQLVRDVIDVPKGKHKVGSPAALLSFVSNSLYSERHEGLDWNKDIDLDIAYRNSPDPNVTSVGDAAAFECTRIRTELGRYRLPTEVMEEANPVAAAESARASRRAGDDTFGDWFSDLGERDPSIKNDALMRGYADPIASVLTSTSQAVVGYLCADAHVDDDRHLSPAYVYERDENGELVYEEDEAGEMHPKLKLDASGEKIIDIDAHTPLLDPNDEDFSYFGDVMRFNAADREAMSLLNLVHSHGVTQPANLACATLGGWTMEDAIVVSKEFAQRNGIPDAETGETRALKPGDKLDFHGCKGVISMVVDRDADLDELSKSKRQVVEFFCANPDLDLDINPFFWLSRLNPGFLHEAIRNGGAKPLHKAASGDVIDGGMISVRVIKTDKGVDVKSFTYGEEEFLAGKGRRTSSQYGILLAGANVPSLSKELFGKNSKFVSDFADRLLVAGIELNAKGELSIIKDDATGVDVLLGRGAGRSPRNIFSFTEADMVLDAKGDMHRKRSVAHLADQISQAGGTLVLPFPLKLASGINTPKVDASLIDGWPKDKPAYLLSVESASLRSDYASVEGRLIVNDHTRWYQRIVESVVDWTNADRLGKMDACKEAAMRAQGAYNVLAGILKEKSFTSDIKEQGMAVRHANSATVVWMPNPDLALDEVGIGAKTASEIGLKEGDKALVWRDPLIQPGGIAYMNVRILPELEEGLSIHPVMASRMDGDFDGDSVGVMKVNGRMAQADAERAFAPSVTLCNMMNPEKELSDGTIVKPPFFNDGVDVCAGMSHMPGLNKAYEHLCKEASEFMTKDLRTPYGLEPDDGPRYLTRKMAAKGESLLRRFCRIYDMALYGRDELGEDAIDFSNPTTFVDSIYEVAVKRGHKGSLGALEAFATSSGIVPVDGTFDDLEKGKQVSFALKDGFEPSNDAVRGTQKACAIKSFGTGRAGAQLQRDVEAYADISPDAAWLTNAVTRSITQGLLSSKHNPVQAMRLFDFVLNGAKELMAGHDVEIKEIDGGIEVVPHRLDYKENEAAVFGEHSQPTLHATLDAWKKNLYEAYDKIGAGISKDVVDACARVWGDRLSMEMPMDVGAYREGERYVIGTYATEAMVAGEPGANGKVSVYREGVKRNDLGELCYHCDFDKILEMAQKNQSLYGDDCFSEVFKPNVIRRARHAYDEMMEAAFDESLDDDEWLDVAADYESSAISVTMADSTIGGRKSAKHHKRVATTTFEEPVETVQTPSSGVESSQVAQEMAFSFGD